MKLHTVIFALFLNMSVCRERHEAEEISLATFCNPVNLSYRFTLDKPSRREAADPTVVWFRGMYSLFG